MKMHRQSPALSYHFVEQSTSGVLTLDREDTLDKVREKVHTATKKSLGETWDVDQNNIVHPSVKSVVIFSDTCGLISCDKDTQLASEVCEKSLLALIPSPLNSNMGNLPVSLPVQVPFVLQSPLFSCNSRRNQLSSNDDMAKIVQQLQEKMHRIEEKLQETLVASKKVIQDNEALRQKNKKVIQDNEALRQENKKVIQDNEALRQENKTLEQRLMEDSKAHQESLSRLQTQNESLQRRVGELEAEQAEHAEWIHSQDTNLLDCIKARHLLTVAQEKLADIAGVGGSGIQENRVRRAHAWKEALGPSKVLSDRLAQARHLLDDAPKPLDAKASIFVQSDEGMRLVSEYSSSIRAMGDRAAHPPTTALKLVRDAVMRHKEQVGLSALMYFACET
ncbi:hypothetical protein JVU11DRAFT_9232 [Chiua virens]|nr:hypothetical protein JVU11DRAFT_9232 [Chiua virens]